MQFKPAFARIAVFLAIHLWHFGGKAESTFPTLDLPNENLKSFVDQRPRPSAPQGDWYSSAAGLFLFRHSGDTQYLHGPGYWFDGVFEARPHTEVDINIRLVAANATSSYGYVGGNDDWFNFGVSWRPHISDSWDALLRYYDLGRQTLGAGLFLEDREMSGALLKVSKRHWSVRALFPGTSVFHLSGDVRALELYHTDEKVEFGIAAFDIYGATQTETIEISPGLWQSFVRPYYVSPIASFFLRTAGTSSWDVYFEAALRSTRLAGRAAFGFRSDTKKRTHWALLTKASAYQSDVAGKAAGNVAYEYLPYSLLLRPYHNAMNVLRYNDRAVAGSVEGKFTHRFSERWFLDAAVEGGVFAYKYAPEDRFVWHKERVAHNPFKELPETYAALYFSNKVLRSNGIQGHERGTPVFADFPFIGFEAQILF